MNTSLPSEWDERTLMRVEEEAAMWRSRLGECEGTAARRRGIPDAEGARYWEAMAADAKEQAEHYEQWARGIKERHGWRT